MPSRDDVELLEDLLVIEARLASAYEAALRRDAIDPELGELLLGHEREHAAALRRALDDARRNPRATVRPPDLTQALRDPSEFARYALRLEARAIDAYAEAAAAMRDESLRQPVGSIMACEAAHSVALRNALGVSPLVD